MALTPQNVNLMFIYTKFCVHNCFQIPVRTDTKASQRSPKCGTRSILTQIRLTSTNGVEKNVNILINSGNEMHGATMYTDLSRCERIRADV